MRTSAVLLLFPLILPACGPDEAPQVEVPSWAHVAPEQIAEAKKYGVPVAFENDIGMRFVLIPAGTFLMGSPEGEEVRQDGRGRDDDDTTLDVTVQALQDVKISKPFYMQTTEVTNGQYRKFDPLHRSISFEFPDIDEDERPVWVAHAGARHLARWLAAHDGVREYRLPSVAEWQYACRANQKTAWWFGNDWAEAGRYENLYFGDDGYRSTAPVGNYPPNPWGLYDMLGNVAEWNADAIASDTTTPFVPLLVRVTHSGGRFDVGRKDLNDREPTYELGNMGSMGSMRPIGFRLVSPLPEPGE